MKQERIKLKANGWNAHIHADISCYVDGLRQMKIRY